MQKKILFLVLCLSFLIAPVAVSAQDSVQINLQVTGDGDLPVQNQGGIVVFPKKEFPEILNLRINEISTNSVLMQFESNNDCVCNIQYGRTGEFEDGIIIEIDFYTHHSVKIEDLVPNTSYEFKISCVDENSKAVGYLGEVITLPFVEVFNDDVEEKIIPNEIVVDEKSVLKYENVVDKKPSLNESVVEEKPNLVDKISEKDKKPSIFIYPKTDLDKTDGGVEITESGEILDENVEHVFGVLFFQKDTQIISNDQHELKVIGGEPLSLEFLEKLMDGDKVIISFWREDGTSISYNFVPSVEGKIYVSGILVPNKAGKWPFEIIVKDINDNFKGEYSGFFDVSVGISEIFMMYSLNDFDQIILFVILFSIISFVIFKVLTKRSNLRYKLLKK